MKNITIGRRSFFLGAVAAAVSSALPATAAHASGGSSGPHVSFATQGHIGEVIVNPYSIAPLTASSATAAMNSPKRRCALFRNLRVRKLSTR